MGKKRNPQREWTQADSALWHTISIVSDIHRRRVPSQRVPTRFPLRANEVAFASGTFHMDSMTAIGDGSYVQSTTLAFGAGAIGVAAAAGTLIGSAAGNASRRARAHADAQVIWRPAFSGILTVTSLGFYLQTSTGLHRWDWESIRLTEIQGFTVCVMQGDSEDGPVTWRLNSPWSELVFALWAMMVHPEHPQLTSGSWIPENWVEWATSEGYPVPETANAIVRS